MKKLIIISILATCSFLMFSCGGGADDKSATNAEAPVQSMIEEDDPMDNLGIGPISSVTLSNEIDQEMAAKGLEVYNTMCTACHKADKKFIGPAPSGILDRRSPEWIMNMILNPEEMVKVDPIAKKLLVEYNNAPMANQNLSEEDARAVLEYFRTL